MLIVNLSGRLSSPRTVLRPGLPENEKFFLAMEDYVSEALGTFGKFEDHLANLKAAAKDLYQDLEGDPFLSMSFHWLVCNEEGLPVVFDTVKVF